MAHVDDKQPLLLNPEHNDPAINILGDKIVPRRRKYRRCSSAPSAESGLPSRNCMTNIRPFESAINNQEFNVKQVLIFLAAYLGIGTLIFFLVRNQIEGKKTNGLIDSIYFCVVTMTTVGYGDLVPYSVPSRLLACVYVYTGMALGALILSKAADYMVEKQEIVVVRAMHILETVGQNELLKEVESHKVKYKLIMVSILLSLLILLGIVFLSFYENLGFVDALYCVCSTITTLGYGDESFSTSVGRIFAIFWILSSTICLAQFYFYLAELYTERRQRSLVKWALTRRMTVTDLQVADLDHDNELSASEFILYKLKEMGKITQEDISVVMEGFRKFDVDRSGTITASDLAESP